MPAAVNQTSVGLLDAPASGVMGFAFQTLAVTRATPFWQALFNGNQLSQPLFSFWLTRYLDVSNATNLEPGGVLTLGGTNSSLYTGDIDYVDITNTIGYWVLNLTGLYFKFSSFAV